MAKRSVVPSDEYREFVFRSSGRTRNLQNVSPVEIRDALLVELDRLRALRELMAGSPSALQLGVVRGLAEVLRDIDERMRAILRAALGGRGT